MQDLPITGFSFEILFLKYYMWASCCIYLYRELLTFVDQFTELSFTATNAQSAARWVRILPMNQYVYWPITFAIK